MASHQALREQDVHRSHGTSSIISLDPWAWENHLLQSTESTTARSLRPLHWYRDYESVISSTVLASASLASSRLCLLPTSSLNPLVTARRLLTIHQFIHHHISISTPRPAFAVLSKRLLHRIHTNPLPPPKLYDGAAGVWMAGSGMMGADHLGIGKIHCLYWHIFAWSAFIVHPSPIPYMVVVEHN
jgi:hypothetical protein